MIGFKCPDWVGFYPQETDKHAYLHSAREILLEFIRLSFIIDFTTLIVNEFFGGEGGGLCYRRTLAWVK